MNNKFFALLASGLLTFGKVLALLPTIALVANIFGGTDSFFLAENFEEEFS